MIRLIASIHHHRGLLLTLIKQDIASSYRQTLLGLVWILLLPLLFISAFTFVRLVLMGGRYDVWAEGIEGSVGIPEVSMAIFVGLIVFWVASDAVTRATAVIANGSVYVTQMRFPAEILVLSVIGVALFHTLARSLLLFVGIIVFAGGLHWTGLLFPLVLLPFLLGVVGVSMAFSVIGAFVRDLQMIVGVAMTSLLFLSGVIFPLSSIPAPYDVWMRFNPIAATIEQSRSVLLWGESPDWAVLGWLLLAGVIVLDLGCRLFWKAERRFADVAN